MGDDEKQRRFGAFLGRKRQEQGLTQTALARAAGISRPYLTQIENGQRMPSEDVVQKLLVMVGAPFDQFITEVMGPGLSDEQQKAALSLVAPVTSLAAHMPPEELLQFLNEMSSVERMAADMMKLAPEDMERPLGGPDGWLELSAEDRKLVQRIVNRLLKEHRDTAG